MSFFLSILPVFLLLSEPQGSGPLKDQQALSALSLSYFLIVDSRPPGSGPLKNQQLFSNSVVSDCCDPMDCSTPGLPILHQLPELAQTHIYHSVIPSNIRILCCPLLLLPSIFPSIRVFSSKSDLHIRWPKDWSFSFSISPSNEHPGLISFRMDWLDLLAVQGTLKSLLQHNSSKASVLQCSAFFMVQLSHPYKTTGKTIALTIWQMLPLNVVMMD